MEIQVEFEEQRGYGRFFTNINKVANMKFQKKFELFYNSQLKPKLMELEQQRQFIAKKLIQLIFSSVILLVLLPLVAAIIVNKNIVTEESLGWIFLPVVVIVMIIIGHTIKFYNLIISPYRKNFKQKIISNIVSLIDKNLIYVADKKIAFEEFNTSELFKGFSAIKWAGEDYVEGTLGETMVKFSEIHAENEITNEEGNAEHHTIFKGLLYIFNLHLDFKGVTLVLPNIAEQCLGSCGRWLQPLENKAIGGKLISLEDPEVEQEFVVYSDHPIMAHYVISINFMRRLLAFRKRLKRKVLLSFVDGKVYMAICAKKDLFEPPIFRTVLNIMLISEYYEYLHLGKEIVEELTIYLNDPVQFYS